MYNHRKQLIIALQTFIHVMLCLLVFISVVCSMSEAVVNISLLLVEKLY
jgi:biopolymer transport protein ExbD